MYHDDPPSVVVAFTATQIPEIETRSFMVLLHGFVKKTQKIPDEDLALARKRMEEIEQ